jgi:hypothetical protein
MDENTYLIPEPRIWLRITLFVFMVLIAIISRSPWHAQLGFTLMMLGLIGTFPHSRINAKGFEKQWYAIFMPVHVQRTKLTQIVRIETDVESGVGFIGGCAIFVFLGPLVFPFLWLADWLLPWLGGDYKLWLRTVSDERVLVWQGNGESNFRCNLAVLEEAFNLPVTRG